MTIIDRYLLWTFLRIFAICFISLCGLSILIHIFTNLDELMGLAKSSGGMASIFAEFYGPRIIEFYDRSVSILLLLAATFSLSLMQRRREMPAIEASGICRQRLLRPVIIGSLVLIALAAFSRESWIPKYKEQLASTAQNWKDGSQALKHFHKDHFSGILFSGTSVTVESKKMANPVAKLPIRVSGDVSKITAADGVFVAADENHRSGLLFQSVSDPEQLQLITDIQIDPNTKVYFPGKNKWLGRRECFVETSLTAEQMALGTTKNEYASLNELILATKIPSQWFSRSTQIAIHQRLLRPLIDFIPLLVILPIVLSQTDKNLLLTTVYGIAAITAFQLTLIGCQSLATVGIIRSASLAAWLPAILFLPLAPLALRLLRT